MCENFTVMSYTILELWITEVRKLDVCKWRVFAKPFIHVEDFFNFITAFDTVVGKVYNLILYM